MMRQPELFWISGSPPCWRVMLALALKGIAYESRRLDSALGQHKAPDYLALNPRGQVPTLRAGSIIIRESVAILVFLDAQWPERPLFGDGPSATAAIWQAVMDFESHLRPATTVIAQTLFRGQSETRRDELQAVSSVAAAELDRLEGGLAGNAFVAGELPSAADCVLYPSLAWLDRALSKRPKGSDLSRDFQALLRSRPALDAWKMRVEAIPDFQTTYPPHWRN